MFVSVDVWFSEVKSDHVGLPMVRLWSYSTGFSIAFQAALKYIILSPPTELSVAEGKPSITES